MNDKNKEDYINMKKQEYIYRCMQKYVKRAAAVFVIGCMVTGLATGCSTNGKSKGSQASLLKEQTREVFAMDTYMTLKAYGKNAGKALDASVKEIERIENLVSTGKKTSEIARINQNGSGKVSEDTMKLILRSRELYEDTDGAFDITVYPVMEAWGFTTEKYRIPGKTELQKLLANMDADKIICDEKKGTVKLDQKGMKIDLGGIAKGYTSGRVMEIMKKYGVKNAVISLGGNVQTLNSKPDGSAWQIHKTNPVILEYCLFEIRRRLHRVAMNVILKRMERNIIISLIRRPDIRQKMDCLRLRSFQKMERLQMDCQPRSLLWAERKQQLTGRNIHRHLILLWWKMTEQSG